ncbi:MAG: SUMF1/EgtB/PvdO family nonheme iron enzyme [Ardenticatenales bacterium]|nr:SUMF1/EgtB/PvdO family nonheme iron enzyme [Ardenticatenales bacterium]
MECVGFLALTSVIPETRDAVGRVAGLIARLLNQENEQGENALLLFVQVLADNTPPGIACRRDLVALAEALARKVGQEETKESRPIAPSSPRPTAPTLEEALQFLNEGDDEKAFDLVRKLKEGGSLRFLDLDQLIATALHHREEEQRTRARDAAYAEIRVLAQSRFTLPQARRAWAEFQAEHPGHDPEELGSLIPQPEAAPKPRVSAEQQTLLDTMLDPTVPPPERAKAGQRLAVLGDQRPGVGLRADGVPDIAWVEVPGGKCRIGGDKDAYQSLPAQEVDIPTFWMAKYPVTNWQYQAFVADRGYEEETWWTEAKANGMWRAGQVKVWTWAWDKVQQKVM